MSVTLPPEIWHVIINHINLSSREKLIENEKEILEKREKCLNELSLNIEEQLNNIENIMNTLNSVNSNQTRMINYIERKYDEIDEYEKCAKELNDLIDKDFHFD